MTARECAVQGCGAVLATYNRSGNCKAHYRFSDQATKAQAQYLKSDAGRAMLAKQRERQIATKKRPCPSPGCHRTIWPKSKMCSMHAALAMWARAGGER